LASWRGIKKVQVLNSILELGKKCEANVGRFPLAALLVGANAARGARLICAASNDSEDFYCSGWAVTSKLSFRVHRRSTYRARFHLNPLLALKGYSFTYKTCRRYQNEINLQALVCNIVLITAQRRTRSAVYLLGQQIR
jgi:hypothetical protein